MKRIVFVWLAAMIMTGFTVSFSGAQADSLGDYARSVRKEKKAENVKQFDNDNLPKTDKLSVVGQQPEETTPDVAAQNTDDNQAAKAEDKAPTSAEEKQKANDEWKQKIDDQKSKVEMASRELDVMQREYRLRAAAMYADAGNRLRNAGSWDKEDEQYKKQIADKQKALDELKQQLEDTQEKARKAGVPAKARE
jgi:uridine phosphorylase